MRQPDSPERTQPLDRPLTLPPLNRPRQRLRFNCHFRAVRFQNRTAQHFRWFSYLTEGKSGDRHAFASRKH